MLVRKLIFFLFLLASIVVIAQQQHLDNQPVQITEMPKEGIFLDNGWKLHTDDNPAYAHSSINDSSWQSVNPAKDIHDLSQLQKGVVWFRLRLQIDSNALNQPLALVIQQSGASEIFVNGKLLQRLGTVSSHTDKIKAYDPSGKPIPIYNLKNGENVLAVRYSLQPNVSYTYLMGKQHPALQVKLCNLETSIDQYQRERTRFVGSAIFRVGTVLILFVLHLAFYFLYPSKKANLYFSLFAFTSLATGLLHLNEPPDNNGLFYFRNIITIGGSIGTLFLFIAFYTILNEKRGWIFWSIMALIILGALLQALQIEAMIMGVLGNLIYLEVFRLIVKAIRSKQRGAWIIAAGAISYVVFFTLFILADSYRYGNRYMTASFTYGDFLYNLAALSIPITISIYLGIDFAVTNSLLHLKLLQVEGLSAKTLQQEREKQEILALQNETLEQQVSQRTAALNKSFEELKSTQAQLVQKEKMASLGELTAGIAHEIQNPLNFINNFSEVNKELIAEMKEEIAKGNIQDVKLIANDVEENEQKINHHGKRADAIVKGMLQHSRTNTGKKELTDINALADEYLRLSYHGFRAKDKSFNSKIEPHFDESIGKIEVIPQDIGRVLLNLFNNAFYAVTEKKRALSLKGENYEPTVWVTTKCSLSLGEGGGEVIISVKDNGAGIPQKAVDKIFQPFFTTKLTGQGTGLGLSLSYDIINAHGGEIKVDTKEGEGAEFIICLTKSI